jgi:hypothetical protein
MVELTLRPNKRRDIVVEVDEMLQGRRRRQGRVSAVYFTKGRIENRNDAFGYLSGKREDVVSASRQDHQPTDLNLRHPDHGIRSKPA